MKQIKNRIEKTTDYLYDNMSRIQSITQFVLACIMMLCIVIECIAHLVMGNITTIFGCIVALIFLVLMWNLLSISWREMRDECKK